MLLPCFLFVNVFPFSIPAWVYGVINCHKHWVKWEPIDRSWIFDIYVCSCVLEISCFVTKDAFLLSGLGSEPWIHLHNSWANRSWTCGCSASKCNVHDRVAALVSWPAKRRVIASSNMALGTSTNLDFSGPAWLGRRRSEATGLPSRAFTQAARANSRIGPIVSCSVRYMGEKALYIHRGIRNQKERDWAKIIIRMCVTAFR